MKRVNVHLTERQLAELQKLSTYKTGLPVAEHIRRAIDAYLKRQR